MRLEYKEHSPLVLVPISLHHDVLVMNPAAVLGYLEKNYLIYQDFFRDLIDHYSPQNILIIIVDSLHRLSPVLRIKCKFDEEKSYEQAMQVGKKWELFLLKLIKELNRESSVAIEIQHWQKPEKITINPNQTAVFKEAVQRAVEQYVEGRFVDQDKEQAMLLSHEYVMEECEMLSNWVNQYRQFDIAYMGTPNPAIQYLCDHQYPVRMIATFANLHEAVKNIEEEKSLGVVLEKDKLGLFNKLYYQDFHLYDRNRKTLGALWDLYFKFLNQLIHDDVFIKTISVKVLVDLHLVVGTFFESMATSMPMHMRSNARAIYYKMAESALKSAELMFSESEASHGVGTLAWIRLNRFIAASRWKDCIFQYLQGSRLQNIKQHLNNIKWVELCQPGEHRDYRRLNAEFMLVQFMTIRHITYEQFQKVENLLLGCMHNINEPTPLWIQSYLYVDFALLYHLAAQTCIKTRAKNARAAHYIRQGSQYCETVIGLYGSKKFNWVDPRNSDFCLIHSLKQSFQEFAAAVKDKEIESNIQFIYHV